MKKLALCLLCQQALAAEQLTLYNDGFALVREQRTVNLQKGFNHLEWDNVSAQIQPETAVLNANQPIEILEQNFDYHLLQEEALLNHFVGQEITVIHDDNRAEKALLLANNGKPVLQYSDRIETQLPKDARLAFPELPAGLKQRPTLSMELNAAENQESELQLSYLSRGFSWKADYIAQLEDEHLDLTAWLTLNNQSGKTFKNAQIQLVAGEVNRVPEMHFESRDAAPMMMALKSAAPVQQEALLDYHLYRLPRPTQLNHRQSKQVNLFNQVRLPAARHYVFQGEGSGARYADVVRADVQLELAFKAQEALPAGVMRVYTADSQGNAQFIGEDRIQHRAEGEEVRLNLGQAFDVYVMRQLLSEKRLDLGLSNKVTHEQKHRLVFHNRKKEAVQIRARERFYGDWSVGDSNLPYQKAGAYQAEWLIDVPAQGETVLEYSVRISE